MKTYLYNFATDKYKGFIPGIFKVFLFMLSLIYAVFVRFLIFFNRLSQYRLNCKVISVGNITLGGTGKTSLVEYIARYLKQQGHKVAIITRGYKRKITSYPCLAGRQELAITSYQTMGDEPYMLSKKLDGIPVIVDANRIRGSRRAIKGYNVDTVIFDDGFQQWRINKNLEIVTIDAVNAFGNKRILPRGILREPLSSLRRADIFVLTKTNLNPDTGSIKNILNKFNQKALIVESSHQAKGFYYIDKPQELINIDTLKNKTVTLFSGIGDPASFENLIQSLGIKIGLAFRFPDHHNYTKEDLDNIIMRSKEKNINTIITTEKDAARLCQLPILALRIELKIKDEQRFFDRLLRVYSA